MFGDGPQAVFFYALTLWSSQVRSQNHARAMFGCVLDGRNRGADPGVVFHLAVFDGNVEVNADEDALALEIKILDGKLWHRSALSQALCGELNADYPTLCFVAFRVNLWIVRPLRKRDPRLHTKSN